MNPEIRDAKQFYTWLWLAPILLIFTAPIAFFLSSMLRTMAGYSYSYSSMIDAIAALALGLPHLWLILPALIAKRDFVRWHARQAFLIGVIQSLVLPGFLLMSSNSFNSVCFAFLFGAGVWLVSNVIGRENAAKGDCVLMRWFGRDAGLPLPEMTEPEFKPSPTSQPESAVSDSDALINLIRFSHDSLVRGIALDELRKLGMVEEM